MRLLGDSIVVVPDEVSDTTAAGIVLPGGSAEIWRYGTVEFVGPGRRSEHTGERIPVDVEVGDRVIHHHAHGQPLELEGGEYLLLAPSQVLAIADAE